MEDTYLDAPAMLNRINKLKEEAETIFKEIEKSRDIMNRLRKYFEGVSADRLQKKFDDIAATYREFYNYLNEKAELMNRLVTNTQRADEEQ